MPRLHSPFTRLALMATLGVSTLVNAHIELLFPPPINSKYDKQTIESNIDYSMTSPLNQDGSNFPCKGYNTPEAYSTLKSVATLQAGSDFEIEFAPGGATHGGGSCQFSVSYDQGKTFAVIYSVEGGCPLTPKYSVPIPDNLPSAKSATFSWTWFNRVGNREMYQNCAIVDIAGSSDSSFSGPALYRANTFEDGSCTTVEGVEPVFPNPGKVITLGGSISKISKITQLDNCLLKQDQDVTISPSGSYSPPPSQSSSSSAAASSSSSSSSTVDSPSSTAKPSSPFSTVSSPPSASSIISIPSKRVPFKDRTAAVSPSRSASSSPSVSSSSSSGTIFSQLPSPSSSSSSSPVWRPVPTVPKSSSATTPTPSSPSPSPVDASSASPTSREARVTRPPYVRKTKKAPIRTPVRKTTYFTKTLFSTATTTSTSIATSTSTATETATTTVTSSACSASPTSTTEPEVSDGADSDSGDEGSPGGTYLQCDTLVTFSLCDMNGCTAMGSVAPGTQCRDGKIVLATATRLIKVRRGAVVGVPLRGGAVGDASSMMTTKNVSSNSNGNVGGAGGLKKRNFGYHESRRHS